MRTLVYIAFLILASVYITSEVPKFFSPTPSQGTLFFIVDEKMESRKIDLSNTREELEKIREEYSDKYFQYLFIEFDGVKEHYPGPDSPYVDLSSKRSNQE
jgi:hypothetical protein